MFASNAFSEQQLHAKCTFIEIVSEMAKLLEREEVIVVPV